MDVKEIQETIQKYQEDINSRRQNLEYMKQTADTWGAFKNKAWEKGIMLLTDGLTDGFKEDINKKITKKGLSAETLQAGIQLATLIKPNAMMGEAINKEIKELKDFFRGEREKAIIYKNKLSEIINKLNNEWSELVSYTNSESMQSTIDTKLNDYMNTTIPESGQEIKSIRSSLQTLYSNVNKYQLTKDFTKDDNEINLTKSDLSDIKVRLESVIEKMTPEGSNLDIVTCINEFEKIWKELEERYEDFSQPTSDIYDDLKSKYKIIQSNLKENYEGLAIMLKGIRNIIPLLKEAEQDLIDNWGVTVNHLMTTYEFKQDGTSVDLGITSFESYQNLKQAIENYIATHIPQSFPVISPMICSLITQKSFEQWRRKATPTRNNNILWINTLNEVIKEIDYLLESEVVSLVDYMDSIYSPLFDYVIKAYEITTTPVWQTISVYMAEISYITDKLVKGLAVGKNLSSSLIALNTSFQGVLDALDNIWEYFTNNDPNGLLAGSIGLDNSTNGLFNSFIYCADAIGLDSISDGLVKGDIKKVWSDTSSLLDGYMDAGSRMLKSEMAEKFGTRLTDLYYDMKRHIDEKKRKQLDLKNRSVKMSSAIKKEEARIKEMESMVDEALTLV